MTMGYAVAQGIYAAAKLGIADLLRDGPKSCDDLAAATDTDRDALYRLLRALEGLGIFQETQQGHFESTPLATCLQDTPGSLREFIIVRGE